MNASDIIALHERKYRCTTCRDRGEIMRVKISKIGEVIRTKDACPECTSQAELEYQDIISEARRRAGAG